MFTDKSIKALVPGASPYRKFEGGTDQGFGIQVSKSAKTFFVQYSSPVTGTRRFMNLGTYPETSLASARERCRTARAIVQQKRDPQIERHNEAQAQLAIQREAERQAEIDKATGTVTELFDAYIAYLKGRGTNTYRDVRNLFEHDIKKPIGAMKARDVTVYQVRDILKGIYDRGAKTRANRARAYMSGAFAYGLDSDLALSSEATARFHLDRNPVRDIPVPTREKPGERDLSASEIRELWARLETAGMQHATKTLLRLLLATGGQRVSEVIGMRWSELDFDRKLWELSAARTKNSRPHVVPLSDLAIRLIRSMEPLANGTFVFPHRDDPTQPYLATSLGRAINRFCKGSGTTEEGFPQFTPRDIRRTVKSRMGEIGILKEIRDRLQNHALHDVSSKHYDRYDYLEPKKQAIAKWTAWLERTIRGEGADTNVIALRLPS
jgi:integrase